MAAGHAVNSAKPLEGQVFYLDTKSFKYTDQLEICICQLGGRVEKFMGKEVTRVISDRTQKERNSSSSQQSSNVPPVLMSRGQRLLNRARHSAVEKTDSGPSDLLTIAAQWNINVMPLKKILGLVKSYGFDVTKKENRPNQGRPVKLRKLGGPFIKFEHSSGQYKPCHMSFVSFPTMYFDKDRHAGSPFCAQVPSRKPAVNVDIKKNEDAGQTPAPDSKETGPQTKAGTDAKGPASKQVEKKKHDKQVQSGYCECCDEWYKELKSHVLSFRHKTFASNAKNYICVDSILDELPGIKNILSPTEVLRDDVNDSVVDEDQDKLLVSDSFPPDLKTISETPELEDECVKKNKEIDEATEENVIMPQNEIQEDVDCLKPVITESVETGSKADCNNKQCEVANVDSGTNDENAIEACIPVDLAVQDQSMSTVVLSTEVAEVASAVVTTKVAEVASAILSTQVAKVESVVSPTHGADDAKNEFNDSDPPELVSVNDMEMVDADSDNPPVLTKEESALDSDDPPVLTKEESAFLDEAVHQVSSVDPKVFNFTETQMNTLASAATEIMPISNMVADFMMDFPQSAPGALPVDNIHESNSCSDLISQIMSDVKDMSDTMGTELSIDDDYVRYVMCNQQTNTVLSADLQGIVSELGMSNQQLFEGSVSCDASNHDYGVLGSIPVVDNLGDNAAFDFSDIGDFIPAPHAVAQAIPAGLDLGFSESSLSDANFRPELHWETIMRSLSEGQQEVGQQSNLTGISEAANDSNQKTEEYYPPEKTTQKKGKSKKTANKENKPPKEKAPRKPRNSKPRTKANTEVKVKGTDEKEKIPEKSQDDAVVKSSEREIKSSSCDKLYNHLDNIIGQVCGSPSTRNAVGRTRSARQGSCTGSSLSVEPSSESWGVVLVPTTSEKKKKKGSVKKVNSNASESSCASFHGFKDADVGLIADDGVDTVNTNDLERTETDIPSADIPSESSSGSFHGFTDVDIPDREKGSSELTIVYEIVDDTRDLDYCDYDAPAKQGSSQGTVMYENDVNVCDIDALESEGDTREMLVEENQELKIKDQESGISNTRSKDMIAEWLGDDAIMDTPYEEMMDTALHRSSDLCHTDISSSMRNTNHANSLQSEESNCSVKKKVTKRKKKVEKKVTMESDSESIPSSCATPSRRNRAPRQCHTSVKKTGDANKWDMETGSDSIPTSCATPSRKDQTRSLRPCDTSVKKARNDNKWAAMPSPCNLKMKLDKIGTPKNAKDKVLEVSWSVKRSGDLKLTFSVDRGLSRLKAKPKVSRRRLLYEDDDS